MIGFFKKKKKYVFEMQPNMKWFYDVTNKQHTHIDGAYVNGQFNPKLAYELGMCEMTK